MPLPYDTSKTLRIPTEAFNDNGIAVLDIHGGRYDGHWVIDAFIAGANKRSDEPEIGGIETCYDLQRDDLTKDDRYPDLAVDTAYVWLNDEMKKLGWRLLAWDNFNGQQDPGMRPYYIAARVVIGSDKFVPSPGVKYADEMTV